MYTLVLEEKLTFDCPYGNRGRRWSFYRRIHRCVILFRANGRPFYSLASLHSKLEPIFIVLYNIFPSCRYKNSLRIKNHFSFFYTLCSATMIITYYFEIFHDFFITLQTLTKTFFNCPFIVYLKATNAIMKLFVVLVNLRALQWSIPS